MVQAQWPGSGSKDHLSTLAKGLQLLEAFDSRITRMTIADAARFTATSRAAARRCLLTLCDLGYVQTDGKWFWLGHGPLRLAYGYVSSTRLPRLIQPILDGLCERNHHSASLAVLFDNAAVIAARATALRTMRVGLVVGSKLPLHCSAAGRALLSALPVPQAEAMLRQLERTAYTASTVTAFADLQAVLATCRTEGYALCDEEIEPGVRSIAVPLQDGQGQPLAALSISTRADRMTAGDMVQAYLPTLKGHQAWVRARVVGGESFRAPGSF